MELFIRAARNDHNVVAKLCAPATAGLWAPRRLPLSGLVTDASVAAQRPALGKTANLAGIPYLVDPLTPLLQDAQPADDAWAQLPFASADSHTPADLAHPALQDELIERTFDFQREHGATLLIPPYLYSAKRGDGWFEVNLALLRRSARYLEQMSIDLPVVPVFAASLTEYGPQGTWQDGLERYLAVTDTMNTRYLALSWSTSTPGHEGVAKLAHLLTATQHAARGRQVIGWRQGLYGLALSACGAAGYETGAGQHERIHYPALAASRRPQPPGADSGGPRGSAYLYLSAFGRSLPRPSGSALLQDPATAGTFVCTDDSRCCPDGADSMINQWREHAIRARSKEMEALAQMPPNPAWRLNSVARTAERAAADARLANAVLRRQELKGAVPEKTFRALAEVVDQIRVRSANAAA